MKIKILIRDRNCNLNICILCDPYQLVKTDHIYFFLRVYKNLEINVCNIYIEQFLKINSDYIFCFSFLGGWGREFAYENMLYVSYEFKNILCTP